MKKTRPLSQTPRCPISRRRFLAAGCAACAGATELVTSGIPAMASERSDTQRIRIVYSLHGETDPAITEDSRKIFEERLARLGRPGALVTLPLVADASRPPAIDFSPLFEPWEG